MLTKGEVGIASLKSFTESGGTIVALHNASQVYAKKNSAVVNVTDTFDEKDFYIPGSILEVAVDNTNPIAFGSTPTVPIFFELSPSFKVSGGAHRLYSRNHYRRHWSSCGSKSHAVAGSTPH